MPLSRRRYVIRGLEVTHVPGSAIRCPACGHALFVVDEPVSPLRLPEPPPAARSEPERAGRLLLRVAEAAEVLAISRSSLYQLVAAGEVRTVRLGRAVRIPKAELERLASGTDSRRP
jgi:excisionase family DNA binding protein